MAATRRGGPGRGLEALFDPVAAPRHLWSSSTSEEVLARLDALADEIRELRSAIAALASRGLAPPPTVSPVREDPARLRRLALAVQGLGRGAGSLAWTGIGQTVAFSRKFTTEAVAVLAALLGR